MGNKKHPSVYIQGGPMPIRIFCRFQARRRGDFNLQKPETYHRKTLENWNHHYGDFSQLSISDTSRCYNISLHTWLSITRCLPITLRLNVSIELLMSYQCWPIFVIYRNGNFHWILQLPYVFIRKQNDWIHFLVHIRCSNVRCTYRHWIIISYDLC